MESLGTKGKKILPDADIYNRMAGGCCLPRLIKGCIRGRMATEYFLREEKTMGQINNNSAVTSYASEYSYRTEQAKKNESTKETGNTAKKNRVTGRTVGETKLSERGEK